MEFPFEFHFYLIQTLKIHLSNESSIRWFVNVNGKMQFREAFVPNQNFRFALVLFGLAKQWTKSVYSKRVTVN